MVVWRKLRSGITFVLREFLVLMFLSPLYEVPAFNRGFTFIEVLGFVKAKTH